MKIGSTSIVDCKIGTTQIQTIKIGTDLIWSSVDPDAQAFITAASITDLTQQSAVNDFYTGLKLDGVYSLFNSLVIPIWGDSSKNKWNWINPVDSDAAHRMTFSGGFTHSFGSLIPNGSNAYANMHIKDNDISNVDFHFSIITASNPSGLYDFGCQVNDFSKRTLLIANNGGTTYYAGYTNGFNSAASSSAGHFLVNYYDGSLGGSTAYHLYKNGSFINGTNTTSLSSAGLEFYLCALNENGSVKAGSYGNKPIKLASVGKMMTSTQAANFYSRVQTLFTALGV